MLFYSVCDINNQEPKAVASKTVSSAALMSTSDTCPKAGACNTTPKTEQQEDCASDECLMARIQNGSRDALGELFRRYAKRLFKIAARVVQNDSEAEELIQELFIYVWDRAQTFDSRKSPAKFWLSQVAYSRALDRRDYLKARRFYDSSDASELLET